MEFRCPKCKAPIADGQTYCGNCRTNIVWRDGKPGLELAQGMQRAGCSIMSGLLSLIVLVVIGAILWGMFSK